MSLNTAYGWVLGDDVRLLLAADLPLGSYPSTQIVADMNYLGANFPTAVSQVRALLASYDSAQSALSTLNSTSEGRTLTKADILEWQPSTPGSTYGPERELLRIRALLAQYFAFSPLFPSTTALSSSAQPLLIRS